MLLINFFVLKMQLGVAKYSAIHNSSYQKHIPNTRLSLWRTSRESWIELHENEVRKATLSRRVPLRLLWRVLRIFQNPTFLTENDITGASLPGRKPAKLKISEIKFWLICCGDAVKRVYDYIRPWFLGRTRVETAFLLL